MLLGVAEGVPEPLEDGLVVVLPELVELWEGEGVRDLDGVTEPTHAAADSILWGLLGRSRERPFSTY